MTLRNKRLSAKFGHALGKNLDGWIAKHVVENGGVLWAEWDDVRRLKKPQREVLADLNVMVQGYDAPPPAPKSIEELRAVNEAGGTERVTSPHAGSYNIRLFQEPERVVIGQRRYNILMERHGAAWVGQHVHDKGVTVIPDASSEDLIHPAYDPHDDRQEQEIAVLQAHAVGQAQLRERREAEADQARRIRRASRVADMLKAGASEADAAVVQGMSDAEYDKTYPEQ